MSPTQARSYIKALKDKFFCEQDANNKDFGNLHTIVDMLYDIECILMEDEYALQDELLEKIRSKKAA